MTKSCAEATIELLSKYGVTTIFGIPGVHTLDFCRALTDKANDPNKIRHVQARNEQGAGFMAEGWARATGNVGVALVISGPGVTNASTALGQCYADSLPLLLISAEPKSESLGKGQGVLHEITEQKKVTEPLTAFSETVKTPDDVPILLEQAFTIFRSKRPRPVHISIPIDIQAQSVKTNWEPIQIPPCPKASEDDLLNAISLITESKKIVCILGGGSCGAGEEVSKMVDNLGAVVITTTAGKGVINDNHPLVISGGTVRAEAREYISKADLILAVGTEMAETDNYVGKYSINGKIIRVDIDYKKINDNYHATVGLVGDAKETVKKLNAKLNKSVSLEQMESVRSAVIEIKKKIDANLTKSEKRHKKFLTILRANAPSETIFSTDACQLSYTGVFGFNIPEARKWLHPVGFCALGNALPNAIGVKMAMPMTPVAVLVGDGGFMFSMPELLTAKEQNLSLPIIIWENGGYKQIQDDMKIMNIDLVGVEGLNPDFVKLAEACHCNSVYAENEELFVEAFKKALLNNSPTIIVVKENYGWLD
jgi:thiamine pyrophosphate-dependent acetolactate synthase large subunit-like protein